MLQAGEDGAEILLAEGLPLVFFDYLLYGNTGLLREKLEQWLVVGLPNDSIGLLNPNRFDLEKPANRLQAFIYSVLLRTACKRPFQEIPQVSDILFARMTGL